MDKKSVIVIIILVAIMVLVFAFGLVSLRDISKEEQLEKEIDNIKIVNNVETDITFDDEKINIYLFFGEGCAHCKALKYFLNNLDSKYKKMFNLYTFEVWHNQDNQVLMYKFGEELDKEVKGVPFLVIGDKLYNGYSTSLDQEILNTIIDAYKKEDKVDIYKKIKE